MARASLRSQLSVTFAVTALLLAAVLTALFLAYGTAEVRDGLHAQQERSAAAMAGELAMHQAAALYVLQSQAANLDPSDPEPALDGMLQSGRLVSITYHGAYMSHRPAATEPLPFTAAEHPELVLTGAGLAWALPAPGGHLIALLDAAPMALAMERGLAGLPPGTAAHVALPGDAPTPFAAGSLDGDAAMKVERRIAGTNHVVVVESDHQTVAALESGIVRAGLLTGGAVALLAATAGVGVASMVARPAGRMRELAERMAQGDFTVRLDPTGPKEIHAVSAALNRMAVHVERDRAALLDLHAETEQRVLERTAEAESGKLQMERFFYGVGHDLKSPLVTARTHLQLLCESSPSPLLDTAVAATNDMRDLVDALLDFARAGDATLNATMVQCGDVVHELVERREALLAAARLHVEVDCPNLQLTTDAAMLERLLDLMIGQAIDRTDTAVDDTVAVTVTQGPAYVRIRVADHGDPLPDHEGAFQPFGKHGFDAAAPGHGLRLAAAKRAVERLGGSIRIARRDPPELVAEIPTELVL